MKKFLIPLLVLMPLAAWALKTWTTGETIKATDLNGNFATLNTAANATITDARISSSAAIAHSKLATPALLPKAWAAVLTACTSTPCTVAASSKVTSIARSGTGLYDVTLAYTPTNAAFSVQLTRGTGVNPGFCYVSTLSTSAPHFSVACYRYSPADGVATLEDSTFHVLVMDDN